MASDDGGALLPAPATAPAPAEIYLPAWCRAYDRLVKMLRKAYAQTEELAVEREHLITELQFLQSNRSDRQKISQICRDDEHRKRHDEAEMAERLGDKEIQIHCHQKFAELAEDDLEDFKSCISNLAAENTELKEKLQKFESQVEISTDNLNHQKSGKDVREEIRKLKEAYKFLKSEKDKEISALLAEKNFVWNQLKTMEQDYSGTIKSKNVEVKQATEAAEKLLQNVDELQVAAQKKDAEIARLQVEVTNAKDRMSILEDELQTLRSMVKDKDLQTGRNEDDVPETSRVSKKVTDKANRSAIVACLSACDRRDLKTPRTRVYGTNQKRKRSSSKSSLSCAS